MPDKTLFDSMAENYDEVFTTSYVGGMQRKRIHEFIAEELKGKTHLKILELNCGTGEDISFLEKFGEVTATDVSEEMLKIARKKNPHTVIKNLDLNDSLPTDESFDIVFSNFGGLNCIQPERLKKLGDELNGILNSEGQLFMVFMNRWSLMEFLYFSVKLNFKKVFRRISGKAEFEGAPIFYYSKRQISKAFSLFKLKKGSPVGLLLSGEYMNALGERHQINDNRFKGLYFILGSDHFLFNFIKSH